MPDSNTLPRDDAGRLIAYAWPGGYPVLYVTGDNATLCPACANGENGSNATDPELDPSCPDDRQWLVVAAFVHYEGAPAYCEHCNGETESAYGDPDADDDDTNTEGATDAR